MNHLRRYLAILLLSLLLLLGLPLRAQNSSRAALIVDFGGGEVVTSCVAFSEPEISGREVLERAGMALAVYPFGAQTAVCAINGSGCPASNCWCQCSSLADCHTWNYWHLLDGAWQYSLLGDEVYTVTDGTIEGWRWGSGPNDPPTLALTFADVCQVNTPPTPTPIIITLVPTQSAAPTQGSTPTASPTPAASSTPTATSTAVPPATTSTPTVTLTASPTNALPTATLPLATAVAHTQSTAVLPTPSSTPSLPTATPLPIAVAQVEMTLPGAAAAVTAAPTTGPTIVALTVPAQTTRVGSQVAAAWVAQADGATAVGPTRVGATRAAIPLSSSTRWLDYALFALLAGGLTAVWWYRKRQVKT